MKLEKKPLSVPGMTNLPKPRPAGAGSLKLIVLALLAILLVGGAGFWLTRDTDIKEQWRGKAADAINNAVSGTPLAGVGDILRESPPPPPAFVTNPMTAPGTLAGQNVLGSVGAPVDGSNPGQSTLQDGAQTEVPAVQKVTEDSRVRLAFIEDLAAFLVSRFKPGPQGGSLSLSVQSLNQRYGVKLTGTTADGRGGRDALLRYVFSPTMLRGIYSLYVDRFLEAIGRSASARALTPEQSKQLHMVLAGRLAMLAGALEGVAAVPDIAARLHDIEKSAQSVVDINSQMSEAVFAVDQLRESKASDSQVSAAQLRVDGLSARYRRALEERAAAQRVVVAAIRQSGGQMLDDDALLFVAQWADRRLRADPQAMAAVQAAADIFRDLARRSAQTGTGTPLQNAVPTVSGARLPQGPPVLNAPQTGGPLR